MVNEKRTLLRNDIIKIKAKALRKGVWFRTLTRVERACVDLAIIVVERVRSRNLQKVLFSVTKKLEEAMEGRVRRLMRQVGQNLACKVSHIAQTWGNRAAIRWALDSAFIQYLTITCMNAPP
jgi:hypothetical protein